MTKKENVSGVFPKIDLCGPIFASDNNAINTPDDKLIDKDKVIKAFKNHIERMIEAYKDIYDLSGEDSSPGLNIGNLRIALDLETKFKEELKL